MTVEDVQDRIFKALADARRRRILDLLQAEPMTTGQLCDEFPELDRCTVMQHIGVLVDADLVIPRRQGRFRWNHLNPVPIKEIHDRWIAPYASGAVALLARLKHDLEAGAGAGADEGQREVRRDSRRSRSSARD